MRSLLLYFLFLLVLRNDPTTDDRKREQISDRCFTNEMPDYDEEEHEIPFRNDLYQKTLDNILGQIQENYPFDASAETLNKFVYSIQFQTNRSHAPILHNQF